jgi:hypothetical protein
MMGRFRQSLYLHTLSIPTEPIPSRSSIRRYGIYDGDDDDFWNLETDPDVLVEIFYFIIF